MRIRFFLGLWFLGALLSQGQDLAELSATGDSWYCVGTAQAIVSSFDMEQGTEPIFIISIQISEGYEKGADELFLIEEHSKFRTQWDANEAKLSLLRQAGTIVSDAEYEALIQDVVFRSSNPNPSGIRVFSITIGLTNYLPATGHYYEFVQDTNVLWTEALEKAQSRSLYGLQGYLATLTLPEEATLVGELSSGTGWIGASDRQEEGVWRWMAGPEAEQVFWDNGERVGYSFWNSGEPNNRGGDEHYAHITADNVGIVGSWNDLQNETATSGPYQAKGYMVEYGGMPGDPELNISTSSQLRMPEITSFTLFKACTEVPVVLTATGNTGEELLWYDQEEGGSPLYIGNVFQPTISTTTQYWVEAPTPGCSEGPRVAVEAVIYQRPTLNQSSFIVEQCDNKGANDGITQFNLRSFETILENNSQYQFRYYKSPQKTAQNEIQLPTSFQNQSFEQTIYVDVINNFGCASPAEIVLKVGASRIDNNFQQQYSRCETISKTTPRGIESWDSSPFTDMVRLLVESDTKYQEQNISIGLFRNEADALLQQNKLDYTAENFSFLMDEPFQQQIWARVDNLSLRKVQCMGIGAIGTLQVNSYPSFERSDNITTICANIGAEWIEVSSTTSISYRYIWYKDGQILPPTNPNDTSRQLIDRGGQYEVLGIDDTNGGCEARIQFTIEESTLADITLEDLTIDDLNDKNNILTVDNSRLQEGDYSFAIDRPDGPFQDEPYFENILPGIHRLYIYSTDDCGTTFIEFSVVGFDTFFTPNQDGFNDHWNILGVNQNFQPGTKIFIFDRTGTLLHQLDPLSKGWDGTYNGRPLPADDYWFRIYFEDGRIKQGHFSLIRN